MQWSSIPWGVWFVALWVIVMVFCLIYPAFVDSGRHSDREDGPPDAPPEDLT